MFVKASTEPLETLFELVNASFEVEKGDSGVGFKNGQRYRKLEHAEEHVADTWLWRDDDSGEVTGCVRVRVENGVAHIGPVGVRPDQQGKGLGRRLMAYGESMAPEAQITVVSCRSDLFPWYERLGYVRVDSVPITDYIPEKVLNRKDIQMVVMRKKCE